MYEESAKAGNSLMIFLDQSGAGANKSRLFLPSQSQGRIVEHFWIQEAQPIPAHSFWRVVPDVSTHLMFVIFRGEDGNVQTRCSLVGPRSRFADVPMANRFLTCGVRLRPGSLASLLRVSASELTDKVFTAEEVFGREGSHLRRRLDGLRSAEDGITMLATFLGDLNEQTKVQPPFFHIEGIGRVDELAEQLETPVRTLYSTYMTQIGISPKLALRIGRLQRALTVQRLRPQPWVNIALQAGYSDQAHMVREFKVLLGESPTAWALRSSLPIYSRLDEEKSIAF